MKVICEVFYGILQKYRKKLAETKEKIWEGMSPSDFMGDKNGKPINNNDIDNKIIYRSDDKATKVLCYTLSTLLRAKVTLINFDIKKKMDNDNKGENDNKKEENKNENIKKDGKNQSIEESKQVNENLWTSSAITSDPIILKNDGYEKSWLRGRNRSYTFVFESSKWRICYEDYPLPLKTISMNEMLLPLMCRVCNKEIIHLELYNADRLFIPETCRYKHKYHLNCLKKKLNEIHKGDVINEFVKTNENYGHQNIVCYQCGYPLTNKDIKSLFREEYKRSIMSI